MSFRQTSRWFRRTFTTSCSRRVSVKDLATRRHEFHEEPNYFILFIPITAFGLGCWQVQRRKWKLNLIAEMDAKMTEDPSTLPDDLNELEHREYQRVLVAGVFDHSSEMYVSPRQELGAEERGERSGMVSNAQGIGAQVITPFVLSKGIHEGLRILVNRGWVPKEKMNPETRQKGQVEGQVELVGIVRHTDNGMFLAENDKESNVWQSRDVYGMAEKLNATPVFLDADFKSSVDGGPLGGQTRVTFRNEHLNYIITWYSLSFLTALMWWRRFFKR